MKKLMQLALAAVCTCAVSFSSVAGIPGYRDCDGWLQLLNRCEANAPGPYYGMTCSEIYYTWRDCKADSRYLSSVMVGKENS